MPSFERKLRSRFAERLQTNVPLSGYTTLRIGGPAQYLLEVKTVDELLDASYLAQKSNIPFYFLAGGSNVLISDEGLIGLTVINRIETIDWYANYTVRISSGYPLDRFVTETAQRGWGDLSFAAGIPGSVGGGLAGGAGAFGHLVCEYLREAKVLHRDGNVEILPVKELGIQYRSSEVKNRQDIILEAELGPFSHGKAEEFLHACHQIRTEREQKHPGSNFPSAGSFFKNLPPTEPGGRRQPAGKFLDEAGVKNLRFGDAGVFEKHANIIVNYGHATASEINQLANEMARRVKEKFGITLEREVQYLC